MYRFRSALLGLLAALLSWNASALADQNRCMLLFQELFQDVQKVHPNLDFQRFRDLFGFVVFDTKASAPLVGKRIRSIYEDKERLKLFAGVPAIVRTKSGEARAVELRTFWLNEVSLLQPTRDPFENHPLFTIHPKLSRFVQDTYGAEKRFTKLPPETMKRVAREDNERQVLDSGWVVISENGEIVAAARLFLPDYERTIEWGIPPPPDRWLLPSELLTAESASPFLSSEHRRIFEVQTALRPQINATLATAAEQGPGAYRKAWDDWANQLTKLHQENLVGEIGRLARRDDFREYDIMPQIAYGIWSLMRQKGVSQAYFEAVSAVHQRRYEAEFFAPWDESGVIHESGSSDGQTHEVIFGISRAQTLRYLRKKGAQGRLTPEQLQQLEEPRSTN